MTSMPNEAANSVTIRLANQSTFTRTLFDDGLEDVAAEDVAFENWVVLVSVVAPAELPPPWRLGKDAMMNADRTAEYKPA